MAKVRVRAEDVREQLVVACTWSVVRERASYLLRHPLSIANGANSVVARGEINADVAFGIDRQHRVNVRRELEVA